MAHIPSLLAMGVLAAQPVSELNSGERVPELRGEFLTGREVVLPQAAEGRVALLLLGFTYESRFAVEAWAGRFRAQFESDPRVTFYEIPRSEAWHGWRSGSSIAVCARVLPNRITSTS